jgi:hypothetical protein
MREGDFMGKDTHRMKAKGWKWILQTTGIQMQPEVLQSRLKPKIVKRDKVNCKTLL